MTAGSGFFVTIEGIEGAGKSSLSKALFERLSLHGREIVVTREPGGTKLGDSIRRVLLESEKLSDRAELLLFEAARAQHIDDVILPALGRGAVVICDRYTDSSIAYQSGARGIDAELVEELNRFATNGLSPNLTILLDLPAEVGLARQTKVDRISSEGIAFHESVRRGYLNQASAEPQRFVIVDATRSFDEVTREVTGIIAAKAEVRL
ncbi:MAG: dTMP kinase [Armatimonadetes bacterium]|nr:dTMP kinase [Armatimonadota bacterium]